MRFLLPPNINIQKTASEVAGFSEASSPLLILSVGQTVIKEAVAGFGVE
jgi:hypothetical protein